MNNIESISKRVFDVIRDEIEVNRYEYLSIDEKREYLDTLASVSKIQDEIVARLPDNYKYLVDEYEEAANNLSSINGDLYYKLGIKMGAAMYCNTIPGTKEIKLSRKIYDTSIIIDY